MTKPYDFHVRTTEPDAGYDHHATIEISGWYPRLDDDSTLAFTLGVYRWSAGVLARTAATLADELADEGVRHHCQRELGDTTWPGCSISANNLYATRDGEVSADEQPSIELHVPPDQLDEWTTKATRRLEEIVNADRWQPTKAHERAWANPVTVQHYVAPEIPVSECTQ